MNRQRVGYSCCMVVSILACGRWHAEVLGQPVAESRIAFSVSPALDLHYHLKSLIWKGEESVPEALRPAFAAIREIHRKTGPGGLSWGMIESALNGCKTAEQIHDVFAGFPETYRSRRRPSAQPVALRDPAVKLARAYMAIEPVYLSDYWPKRKRMIDARLADIRAGFEPKMAACIGFMLQHLGMEDPHATIPVYLVVDMPRPGAHTYVRHDGGALCVISINRPEFEGPLLHETILHEATHALDIEAGGEDVFDAMRRRLEAGGMTRRDKLFRDVPHTVMFVQAAETMRRVIDRNHTHYGEASKYYDRVSTPAAPVGKTVCEVWTRYLDGEITQAKAIDVLVEWTLARK